MTRFENWVESGLDTKVIVRSNEDEPYKVGELVGFERIGEKEFPLVEVGDTKFMCMGIVIPYSSQMEIMLNGMDNTRQWEVMKDISLAIQILKGRRHND